AAFQCHLSVPVSATYQCASVPPISARSATYQCRLSVPDISAAYQCQISVLPISARYQCCLSVPDISVAYQCRYQYQCCLSVPISDASLAHISEGEKSLYLQNFI
ncbi:unnamed protein product, partial [Staurois parvus]